MGTLQLTRYTADYRRKRRGDGSDGYRKGAGVSSSEQHLREAIEFWQPLSERRLSQEDARQITHNVVGFFSLLSAWADSTGSDQGPSGRQAENGGGEL
jgi:hypothetical protein